MSENENDLFALIRRITGQGEPAADDGDGEPTSRPSPIVTPTLANQGAPAPAMGPLASSIGAIPASGGGNPLLARTREAVAQSHLPSEGENLRQQMLSLGAAMASSQNRSFGGALGDGVTAMQRQQQQQAQSQRQLLETEGQNTYREAQMRVQQAQMAMAEDPTSPENRARLMTAMAALARAQRPGGGSGSANRQQLVPGSYFPDAEGNVRVVVAGRDGNLTSTVVPNMRPEDIPGRDQREATAEYRQGLREDRANALVQRTEDSWIQRRERIYNAVLTAASRLPAAQINPSVATRAAEEAAANFARQFPPPASLRARDETPTAPAATPGRTIDFNR